MNVLSFSFQRLSLAACIVLLSACAAQKPDTATEPSPAADKPAAEKPIATEKRRPVEKALSPAEAALKEGIALYNEGNFSAAIKRLNTVADADKLVQLQAYKYAAFSYCVSGRQMPCRQQFEKALKLDPGFDLEPGEKGHPLWGNVFERAKKRKK